ncbi:hypothetical protein LCGC14_1157080 [marine sediment metagenome]|uniref:DUF83 domain-containing protein n=1 Tax=marine sediment metagenome TaxID=412755 RepID=A0A0F9LYQ8_9ZZZZ
METFDIITPVIDSKKRKIKLYPQHVNRASSAGHPCEKYLVFCRTRWEEKLPHDVGLEFIFEGGRMVEEIVVTELKDAGFSIIEQQKPFVWKEFELTGHLDFKILKDDETYPVEVKGLNMFDFDKLDCIEDFLGSKKVWIRGYPTQLTLYMLMDNVDLGVFYLKRIPGFKPKQIWISLDYTYGEDILKKLERVNKHVKEGTVPEPISDYDICNRCGFLPICLPDMVGKEIEIIDEIEIEEAIKRTQELKPLVSEYNKLDKKWKTALKEKEKVMIGDYVVIGKWVKKKGFTVLDTEYWQSKLLIKPDKVARSEE